MNQKTILNTIAPLLSAVACFSGTVNAEGLRIDSVSQEQITQTVQSNAKSEIDENLPVVQDSLTDTLVKKLSISTEQAQGGAGALFQLAKSNLDTEQFSEISKAVPEMDSLLGAASNQSNVSSNLAGNVASVLGDNSAYGDLAVLGSAFKDLNLSPDMVDQFVPVVVDYVRTNSGDLTANILQSALYSGS